MSDYKLNVIGKVFEPFANLFLEKPTELLNKGYFL